MMRIFALLATALFAATLPFRAMAADVAVDVELVIAVDVSRSMDTDEQRLQRLGYVQAMRHPEVLGAIRSGLHGSIAVTYFEWAGPNAQRLVVPWTRIETPEDADRVASMIQATDPIGRFGTSISSGLVFAAALFEGSGFAGERRVIDVSGDGPNNMGAPVIFARDAAIARGITINGLPIVLRPGSRAMSFFDIDDLDRYYQSCVVGGPGAFTLPVRSTAEFETAIRRKLVLEIAEMRPKLLRVADRIATSDIDCLIGEKLRGRWMDR